MSSIDLQVGAQSNEEPRQAQEERYTKLMRAIAWLYALRNTAIPDVVAAQRSRLTDELCHIVRRQGMRNIHIDVTERELLEEHKNLLIRELDHRFKNMLSVISVIASRTQETSSSAADFVAGLDGRIKALMTTHELLSRRSWHGISVSDLVHQELAPYATANNTEIKGPDDILLSADAGQVMGMVLHELATNAANMARFRIKTVACGCVGDSSQMDRVRTCCASSGRSMAVHRWFHRRSAATAAG